MICQTKDLRKDAHIIFKQDFFFVQEFSETFFYGKK